MSESCLHSDGAAIAAAAIDRPDGPVPACPGWTMADLADHVARSFANARASLLATDGVRPPLADTVDPLAVELARLLEVVDDVDPAAPRPTLFGPRPAAWWIRRMHHEAAVHRVDAHPGVDPTWIAPDCAADGIDEYLTVMVRPSAPMPVRLDAIDAGASFGAGDDAEVVVAGPAVDLFLLLWKRRPLTGLPGLAVSGDPRAYEATLGSVRV